MTSLVAGAKRLVGLGSREVAPRVAGLQCAVEAGRGRLDDVLLDDAQRVVDRAGARLRLSDRHTVVALGGATGSGKSSTFNALSGLELAAVGVRRPTTSTTLACVWGVEGAGDLLDWLGVPRRHQLSRDSLLDDARPDRDLDGLVLLDLPDHDSTELDHHAEVDRVVALADLLVWVLDPQKYADAAIHERYLRPFADHRDVMVVVLNHADTVPVDARPAMLADLHRLLDDDGLDGVPVVTTAAPLGDGIPELRALVASRVSAKRATRTRLLADVSAVARRMGEANGDADPGDISKARTRELVDAFADAAGVPTVVDAVEKASRLRAARATGWPVTSWLGRLRPDPLKRLHLDLGPQGRELTSRARTSVPRASAVQRARVDTAVRALADDVSARLTPPWTRAVRRASLHDPDDLGDALDQAVTGTGLGVSDTPLWWRAVRLLQRLLLVFAAAGAIWLGVLAVLGFLRAPQPDTPDYHGVPVPTALLVGGVLAGLVVGLLCRVFAGVAARSRARSADRRLRAAIGEVAERRVLAPVRAEVEAYRTTRAGLDAATR